VASTCVSCGAEVGEGARFCQVCGASLWQTCPTCGSEERASAAFCSSCGFALRSDAARTAVSKHEERRVVTVLFADLAGSTRLGERVEPEDVRTIQGELNELVNSAVELHGGVTEKFVGAALLAVFGAPVAHEDDADRAVRAALSIRDSFPAFAARVSGRHDVDVGLRVGVNTGEVIAGREAAARGELMVSGDVVNTAARLQQLAHPGSVLVGERTRAATQLSITYQEPRDLEAKGKDASVLAYEAVRAHAPLAARARRYASPLVGREEELALLRLIASRVQREQVPQLVTIFGNAGVGKSRLLDELCAGLESARVVTGACVPYGDGITYLPLVEVARELTGAPEDDPAEVAYAKVRTAVESAVPADQAARVASALAWTMGLELPEEGTGVSMAGDIRRTLHEGWSTYLRALGHQQLVVLVIDDIHWASEPLLDLLDAVITTLEDTAVLILCPARPELLDLRPAWGTGRMHSSSLTLSPLGPSEAEGLLRALLDDEDLPDDVARAILEPAEGNPFFVEEMLSMLVEHGALARQNGGWSTTEALRAMKVPDSIHGVIAARIDLLQAQEREALRRCSVMGRVFWPSAVGIDDDVIAALGARALVSEQAESSFGGRREFAFKHALTHDVAYATLPRTERRELHRSVAGWIANAVPDRRAETMELIAYHYEQALAHGERDHGLEAEAFAALSAAADASTRRGLYATAAGLVGRALELAPTEEARARTLLLAAQIDIHTAHQERAVERLDETISTADRLGDRKLRADALGSKTRACWLSGSWREALDSGEEAVATLEGEHASAELARALARLSQIQMLRGLPETEATARRAIAVARESGELGAEANARINLFTTPGSFPSAAELAEIIDLATRGGVHDEAVRAVINYLWSVWLHEPLDVVEESVARYAQDLQGWAAEAYAEYLRLSLAALIYVPAGRWAEAGEIVARDAHPASASSRLAWYWVAAGLALRTGDLQTVDALLPQFRESALASEEPQRILPMVSVALPRALMRGDSDDVRELAAIATGLSPNASASSSALAVCRALAAAQEPDTLLRFADGFAPLGGVVASTVRAARALRALLDGDPEGAAVELAVAERELSAFGRSYEAACVALDLAGALDAADKTRQAQVARDRAMPLLERLGCVYPW
jgi:class 3 adenylate cyclase/tetratricopeptide (TPR) repeat protein